MLIWRGAVHWMAASGWRCWGIRRHKRQWNGEEADDVREVGRNTPSC